VAFETIGLYRLPLHRGLSELVRVGVSKLIEPVKTFGVAYRAIPDDDEFECEYNPDGDALPGEIDATGSNANAGRFLQADLEGLSIIVSVPGHTLMLASSQGDSSFHFYQIGAAARHLGSFLVEGVSETDGVDYVPVPLSFRYPLGLLVVQNGDAPRPPGAEDVINGYEFDGATQFKYVNFLDTLRAFRR
jgi:3-phytase